MNSNRTSTANKRGERGQARLATLGALAAIMIAVLIGASVARDALADPVSPLAVTKTANPSPVASGDQLTYTITMTNTGGSKLSNLVMTDQVNGVGVIQAPPALPQLQITSSQGTCTQGGPNGNVVTCNGGSLPGRGTWTVTIRGQVTAANGTTLNNTASVTGTKSAQTFSTSATVQVLVQGGTGGGAQPDLTINKTGPSSVAASSPLTYTLTVNNIGPSPATNVRVVDTLPAGVSGIGAAGTSLFVCGVVGQTVTCDGGAVNAGANATITINGTSPAGAGTITNTAVVDPNNTIAESNELNNTSAVVYTDVGLPPSAPLLDIKKTDGNPAEAGTWWTGAGPDPVTPGQQITYKIQVTNNATGTNSRADDVIVTDGTQGLEASSIMATQVIVKGTVGTGGGCVVTAPQVRCSIRSLDSGGTLTITITGTVIASAGSTIFNTATVTGNIKNTGVTNTDSEATTVKPAVDLTITKADSPDPVCARSWPIDGIPFPPGPAGSQHLPLSAAAPPAAGSPTELLAPPVCLGGLTYSFVVGNSGIQDATGVVVRDPLPAGLIFDTYDTDAGFLCTVDASNVVTCSGGTIPAESIRSLVFRLVAPPNLGIITNTVYVDPNNAIFEPDETNNTFAQPTDVVTGVDLVTWKSDCVDPDPPGDDVAGAPTLTCGTGVGPNGLGDGFDPIATRGTQTYTVYVDNVGTQNTTGIRLRDTLPADTIFLSVIADPLHGFTCAHDGSATGGTIECVGGHLLGTESEFYDPAGPPPAGPGDDFATIKIRVFARSTVGTMHNEVRVDPLNEIPEVNELNNLNTNDTVVGVGNNDKGAYHQLGVVKTHNSPAAGTVATNGVLIYNLDVTNYGTDPVSNIVLVDSLPAGTRYIEAKDTDTGTDAFFCTHDGSPTGGVITCTGGDLDGSINTIPVGATTRRVTVKVFAPNIPGMYNNLATVDPNNLVPEGNEFDNDAQLQTTVAPCTSPANCTATNAFYELTIDKTQNRPTIARNGVETYSILITNLGSDPVFDIVVQDNLPEGSILIDAKDTAGAADPDAFACGEPDASGILTCTGGDLSGTLNALAGIPTSRTIEIRVFMPDTPGVYPNQAFVDPFNAIPEGNEFNNTDSLTTDVQNGGPTPFIDLKLEKTQTDPDPNVDSGMVTPGGGIRYTLHVSNLGEATAYNVTVRDILPATATFFAAFDAVPGDGMFTCGFLAPNVTCTGGAIPAGGSRDIFVFVDAPRNLDQVASDQGNIFQVLTNEAVVDPDNEIPEGDETNNSDVVQTTVKSKLDLSITKSGPTSATQNQTTQYTVKVKNNIIYGGGATAFGVKVVDNLPVGLIIQGSVTADGNFTCQTEQNPVNKVTCNGDLAADGEVTITIPVFITADGGTLDNEACVDPDHTVDETTELNNCQHALTDVNPAPTPANLSVNKSADKGTVTAGDTLTYTISVSNQGGTDASGTITVTDTLPTEVTKNTINPDAGWDCSTSTATVVTCTRTGLPAGATSNIQVVTTVNAGATGQFTNTANVTGNSQDINGSVTTNAGGSAIDLVLSGLTDAPDPANVGQNIKYSFTVTNGGSGPSGAFDITATMDTGALSGLTFVGAAASQGFICGSIVTDTVTCTGSLLAGQSTNVEIEFTVNAATPTTHTLDVKVDPTNAIAESTDANNDDSETTTVTAALCTSCIDLVMGGILAFPNPLPQFGPVNYIVTASNAGDLSTAPTNATVSIFLDPLVVFSSASASLPGFTCALNAAPSYVNLLGGQVLECTGILGPGEGVAISVIGIDLAPAPAVVTVAAWIDPGDAFPEGTGPTDEFTNANNGPVFAITTVQ